MTSADYQNQLNDLLAQQKAYTPVSQGDIYADLSKKVNNFEPQRQEIANLETQAYAAPANMMSEYYNNYGTEAGTGPSAMSRLSSILGNVGNIYGTANVARGNLANQQGNLKDIAGNVYQRYMGGLQNLQNQIGTTQGLYGTTLAAEQQAAALAEQRRIADAQAAALRDQMNQQNAQNVIANQQYAQSYISDAAKKIVEARNNREPGIEDKLPGVHAQLMQVAQRNGLQIDPEQLWVDLGNTPSYVRFTQPAGSTRSWQTNPGIVSTPTVRMDTNRMTPVTQPWENGLIGGISKFLQGI